MTEPGTDQERDISDSEVLILRTLSILAECIAHNLAPQNPNLSSAAMQAGEAIDNFLRQTRPEPGARKDPDP